MAWDDHLGRGLFGSLALAAGVAVHAAITGATTAGWIATGWLGFCGLANGFFNHAILIGQVWKKKHVSFVPPFGIVLVGIALGCSPSQTLRRLLPVALVVDPLPLLWIAVGSSRIIGACRARTNRR